MKKIISLMMLFLLFAGTGTGRAESETRHSDGTLAKNTMTYAAPAAQATAATTASPYQDALPVSGKQYYFYNKRKTGGDRYYYDKSGSVGFDTSCKYDNQAYIWTCEQTTDGKYTFKNASTQKYFAWKSLTADKYEWTLSATVGKAGTNGVVNAGCVTLFGPETDKSTKRNVFLIGKADGFDQSTRAGYYDETLSSDFCFVEITNVPCMPVAGKNYYMVNKHMSGDQYFSDNNGVPGFGKKKQEKRHFVWICEDAGNGKLAFKNLQTGQYFAWKKLSSARTAWTVSNTNQVSYTGCVTLRDETQKSSFLVCKEGSFDQAGKGNYYDATYSSNFYFVECKAEWKELEAAHYLSTKYGDKWVRLNWKNNQGHAAGFTNNKGSYDNRPTCSEAVDLTSAEQLWTLVGNENDGFLLQNKAAGETLALYVANTNQATAATMTAKDNATKWKLVKKGFGIFAITPKDNAGMSLNSYGGELKDLKLYSADDAGSQWAPQCVVQGLTMRTEVKGELPETMPFGVGNLLFTVDGVGTKTRVTGSTEAITYYLPENVEVELTQSDVPRGFTKGGFTVNKEKKDSVLFTTKTSDALSDVVCIFNVDPVTGQYLYLTPDAKGYPYRIPAIATAPNGDIFAISDNRPCRQDIGYGEVDIKCRISKDNGQTWGEEFMLADGLGDANNGQVWKTGFGDAAVVADAERNELLVMMVCGKTICHNAEYIPNNSKSNPNRVARVRAKYNEKTGKWDWTDPVEVTEDIYKLFVKDGNATVTSLFIGSGRICQSRVTKVGDYYRLYCSVWTKNNGNRVLYSDDFGESWKVLGTMDEHPGVGGDEPKCEEMPDGSVILSSRSNGRLFNIYKYTNKETGEGKWLGAKKSQDCTGGIKVGNSTNGEIMLLKAVRKSDNTKVDLALQSVPFGSSRCDAGIFFKEIKKEAYNDVTKLASDWTKGLQVSTLNSAYTTMTLQQDNRIGFFFEEAPGEYCMVYIPLTIEQITKDQYKLDAEAYPSFSVQTHDAGQKLGCALSTFSANCATTPALKEVKAFYVSAHQGDRVQLTEIVPGTDQKLVIPANTGVILRSDIPSKVVLRPCKEQPAAQTISGNLLKHTAAGETKVSISENAYILSGDEEGAAFFKLSSDENQRTIAANRAYLVLPQSLQAQLLTLTFDEITGIGQVNGEATLTAAPVYDLSGRRVMHPVKNGIYIQGGKKFILK